MKKRIMKPALFLCLLTVFAITCFYACSKSGSSYGNGGGNGAGNAVSIKNFAFSVSSLSVAKATTVTWTNNDAVTHTVTADDASFDSGNIAPGATFSHIFNTAGTVAYHCSIHTSMKANVVIAN
ncbi:MAG: cupredoxin family copper-binding protein [Parafilimonas sp.]